MKIDCFLRLRNHYNLRLRAVSYFSLQSYYTRNLSTRAAKPRAARNEGVSLVWSQSLIVIITSWFAIALDEIRTRQKLREKADCKQSITTLVRCVYIKKPERLSVKEHIPLHFVKVSLLLDV